MKNIKKMKMRSKDIIFWGICVFLLVIASIISISYVVLAANYYVKVHEGIGTGSGDHQSYENNTILPLPINQYNHTRKVSELIGISVFEDKLIPIILISENIKLKNYPKINSTAEPPKEPINWTPYIVWGIVILCVGLLAFGCWYIYQVYFY